MPWFRLLIPLRSELPSLVRPFTVAEAAARATCFTSQSEKIPQPPPCGLLAREAASAACTFSGEVRPAAASIASPASGGASGVGVSDAQRAIADDLRLPAGTVIHTVCKVPPDLLRDFLRRGSPKL